MFGNSIKKMLRTYLKADVDETLLNLVAMDAHEVLYTSQQLLCEKAGVDEAQLLAFFQAFEVDNFAAFKFILRKCLYYEAADHGVERRSPSSLADEVLFLEMRNLSNFALTLDREQLMRLARDITAAPEVNIFAYGATKPLGVTLRRILWLFKIRYRLFTGSEPNEQKELERMDSSGLVIVFCRKRYSMQLLMRVSQLRQRGFRIVAVADSEESPVLPLMDYHFVLPFNAFDYNDSLVSGMTFLHILSLYLTTLREDTLYAIMHQRDIETQENNMFW